MPDSFWILGLRLAGCLHFLTLILASFTPIPPGWDVNLAMLPPLHRRFALIQNLTIGAVIRRADCRLVADAVPPAFRPPLTSRRWSPISCLGPVLCHPIVTQPARVVR